MLMPAAECYADVAAQSVKLTNMVHPFCLIIYAAKSIAHLLPLFQTCYTHLVAQWWCCACLHCGHCNCHCMNISLSMAK